MNVINHHNYSHPLLPFKRLTQYVLFKVIIDENVLLFKEIKSKRMSEGMTFD